MGFFWTSGGMYGAEPILEMVRTSSRHLVKEN